MEELFQAHPPLPYSQLRSEELRPFHCLQNYRDEAGHWFGVSFHPRSSVVCFDRLVHKTAFWGGIGLLKARSLMKAMPVCFRRIGSNDKLGALVIVFTAHDRKRDHK